MNIVIRLLILILSVSMLNACGGGSGDSATTLPSTEPGGEVGEVSDSGLWIDLADTSSLYTPYFRKDSTFGEDCLIPGSVTVSSSSNDCIIDVLETDSYVHEFQIQYNIPKDMCDYVIVTPSWHWNYSVGYGPTAVTIEAGSDGSLVDLPGGVNGGCETVENGVGVDCSAANEIYEYGGSEITCEYDYRTRNTGPNCCLGEYQLTTLKDLDDDGTVDSTETLTQTWGGLVENCTGGIIQTGGWPLKSVSGYPISKIQYVGDKGINDIIQIPSNASGIATSFQYGTNWYETSGSPHLHDGFVSATTSTLPYAFEPVDDLDGTPVPSGTAPYIITCTDRGREVKHQFRVYIREWNTFFDFLAFGTSLGVTDEPDKRGSEGGGGANDCEYEPWDGGNCNDYSDFDDILFSTGGSYDTSTPNATLRRSWFPGVKYD